MDSLKPPAHNLWTAKIFWGLQKFFVVAPWLNDDTKL